MLSPTSTTQNPPKRSAITIRTLRYYLRIAFHYKYLFTFNVIAVSIATVMGNIVVSYFLARLLQQLAHFNSGIDAQQLYNTVWVIVGVKIIEVTFWRINDYSIIYRQSKTLRDLEQFIFHKLQFHSYRFYTDNFAGSLVAQTSRFVRSYQELEGIFFFDLLQLLIKVVFSVGVLLVIAPLLGVVLLVWAIFFVSSVTWLTIKKSPITRVASTADSNVTAVFADTITNMLNVKTFARAGHEERRFNRISQDRYKKRLRSFNFDAHIRSYRWALLLGLYFAFAYLSVYLVTSGHTSAVAVTTAQLYVLTLYGDLLSLNQTVQRVEQSLSEAAELTEILDLPPEVQDPTHPEKAKIEHGLIEFKDVDFRYPNTNSDVLNDFSLLITPGQKIGLVGHSGSGKSTLSRILMRFIDLQQGKILIDGQNITQITQDDLRSHIAFVPQEPILFHRSLMENIRYGREDATDEEVFTAARLAHAADFIESMPQKYETLVGERGIKLSGGEKQRVAIARAMLSRAPILVLDEATSALDSKSEKLITSALDSLMKNRTTIVIAHRLSTIRKMDRILVMKTGAIIEDGSHQTLLDQNGEYAELWAHQSGGFLEE
ncbi:MAG: ABC transporter ATP-binding protein [Patescibacteria group bacterium]